jgi:intracellular sulfur oxidation DsrE/DsrF family protein
MMVSSVSRRLLISIAFLGGVASSTAQAGGGSNNECPVGLVTGKTLNDEFGPGTGEMTRCLERRHNVKVVMQVNKFCRDAVSNPDCTRAYALGNMRNMIKDYEITHGMEAGKDYEIVAVVHSGGGWLMLKDEGTDGTGNPVSGRNQFEGEVKGLIDMGVKFYFCQNTTRGFMRNDILPDTTESTAGATGELIDGVKYTTAGVTSIAEFQQRGYEYVQP